MKMKTTFWKSALFSLAITAMPVIVPNSAFAQVPAAAGEAAASTASPDRVQDQIIDRIEPPELMPSIEVESLLPQSVPDGADDIEFTLNSITFENLSAYTPEQLRPVYADQLGQMISLADLYAIAARLTRTFRNDGFILTQVVVPPQTIEGGDVRLNIIEGFIDQVSVSGDDDARALDLIQAYADRIADGRALNAANLERALLLINDLPGVSARAILSPSQAQTGAADLQLIIERDPFDALLAVDNYGSRYLGPLQFSAAGSLNSFFGFNERISAQIVAAPNSDPSEELIYFSMAYEQPINTYGTRAELFFSQTHTEPGFNLEQFDVQGKSQFFAASLEHPFIRSRRQNLTGSVVFDWRDLDSKNNLEATREDRIRAARAGMRYEFLETFWGVGINVIDLELSQGLNIFGASGTGSANLTRANGDPRFTKANLEIQRLQRLTNNIDLLLVGRGQISDGALLSSEEFGVGGINIGRGFDPSEIVGDEGVSGKLELQWDDPVQWNFPQTYEVYSFFDAGRVWNDDATSSSTKRDTITSAGVGLRMDFLDDTQAEMSLAFPLNRDVETQNDRDPKFYFSLSRRF